ncbi:energy transducer TonB [Luteimonas sp. A482]
MRRHLCGCVLMLWFVAGAVHAAGAAEARRQVEASMLVTGRVTITLEGTVSDWTIDQRNKLPPAVANVIDAAAPGWRFEPILVDGKPAHGSARMSLLMLAERVDARRFRVTIRSGYFGREAVLMAARHSAERSGAATRDESDQLSSIEMKPPEYPVQARYAGAHGVVYVVVRVDRTGRVQDAVAEMVNLRVLGTEREMVQMRELLAKSALVAARKWTFQPPTRGEWADQENWSARVPVDYRFADDGEPGYGQWQSYVAGPRNPIPWEMEGLEGFDIAPDALVSGVVHQVGTGLKLLVPLEGG